MSGRTTPAGLTFRRRIPTRSPMLTLTPANTASTHRRTGTAQKRMSKASTTSTSKTGVINVELSMTIPPFELFGLGYFLILLRFGNDYVPVSLGTHDADRCSCTDPDVIADHIQSLIAKLTCARRPQIG